MRLFAWALPLLLVLAGGAFAGVEVSAVIENPAATPGDSFRVDLQAANDSGRDRRVHLRLRIRGHRLSDARSRRYRTRAIRTTLTVPANGQATSRIEIPIPADAGGAVQIDVRRAGRRQLVDAFVTTPLGDTGPGAVEFQPLLRLEARREFDGQHSARTVVVRDRESLDGLLDDMRVETPESWGRAVDYRDHARARPVPVDFEREMVLAIFAGTRPHEDFVRVRRVRRHDDGSLTCRYRVVRHRPLGRFHTADHVWAPCLFVTVPRTDADVAFVREGAPRLR